MTHMKIPAPPGGNDAALDKPHRYTLLFEVLSTDGLIAGNALAGSDTPLELPPMGVNVYTDPLLIELRDSMLANLRTALAERGVQLYEPTFAFTEARPLT
ncbi:hypothetical protein [Micromonospora sp. NPDC005652]|uniref:hypothetical protein n=1 Tax=Micromonospora sp. NPDC005652 TaxID=3157046 RepID=UPI0033FF2B36